jgi:hypothetical protein
MNDVGVGFARKYICGELNKNDRDKIVSYLNRLLGGWKFKFIDDIGRCLCLDNIGKTFS